MRASATAGKRFGMTQACSVLGLQAARGAIWSKRNGYDTDRHRNWWMEAWMRLALLAIGIILGYALRQSLLRRRTTPFSQASMWMMALGVVGCMAALHESALWGDFWRRDPVRILPFDAALAGVAAGLILADAPVRLRAQLRSRADKAGTDGGKSAAIASGLALALPLIMLIGLGAAGGSGLAQLVGRLQGVSGAGVNITLAPSTDHRVAAEVRTAAGPSANVKRSDPAPIGYSAARLGILQDLTYPPNVEPAEGGRYPTLAQNAAVYALAGRAAEPVPGRAVDAARQNSSMIARDRATLRLLLEADRSLAGMEDRIDRLALGQERLLSLFGPHIHCLATVTLISHDTRVLEHRAHGIVEQLSSLARHWMFLADRGREQHREINENVIRDMRETISNIITGINGFSSVTQGVISARRGDNFPRDERNTVISACNKHVILVPGVMPGIAESLLADIGFPPSDGLFAPYVAIFAAQSLAAIGDHRAAVALLADWVEVLDRRQSAEPRRAQGGERLVFSWFRMRAIQQIMMISRASESSENPILPTAEGLRFLLNPVFSNIMVGDRPANWLNAANGHCRDAELRWRQNLMLSYFSYVKEYLDQANLDAIAQGDLTESDVALAQDLRDVDLSCFPNVFDVPGSDSIRDRTHQRVNFLLTYATTTLRWIDLQSLDASRVAELRRQTEPLLRNALLSLQRLPPAQQSVLRQVIYRSETEALIRAVQRVILEFNQRERAGG